MSTADVTMAVRCCIWPDHLAGDSLGKNPKGVVKETLFLEERLKWNEGGSAETAGPLLLIIDCLGGEGRKAKRGKDTL